MVRRLLGTAMAAVLLLAATTAARADEVMTNGSLTVTIRSSNGAIGGVVFGGSDWYNQGIFVSDFGFQVGTDTSTFVRMDTNGFSALPGTAVVLNGDGSVTMTGTYAPVGSGPFLVSRTYSLVSGQNVLRTATTVINGGVDAVIRMYDTFDPDQGIDQGDGFATFNDVYGLGSFTVLRATEIVNGLTVVMGSADGATVLEAGHPSSLLIFDGDDLNRFFSSPNDDNGSFSDRGVSVGREVFLATGTGFTFVFDQAYGRTQGSAEDGFLAANGGAGAVPEPASLVMAGLGVLGLVGYRLRRKVA